MHGTASSKNRYLHRGGFTPYQLVLGQNPRMPNDVLSDGAAPTAGSSDRGRGRLRPRGGHPG
eukprot:5856521-Pyramimonas_sp.AAC.1